MNPQSNSNSPFVVGPMITEQNLFVGRTKELEKITRFMQRKQPASVNIFGEERIGKSSLLYHFYQIRNENRYVVIYINLQQAGCNTEDGFYEEVIREWKDSQYVQNQSALTHLSQFLPLNRQQFSQMVRNLKQQGVIFVLCLDEFEALFMYSDQFDKGFYGNLYSLILRENLMLVVASQKSLSLYKDRLDVQFYKMFEPLNLSNLSKQEAEQLVKLPTKLGVNSPPPVLDDDQQAEAQKWGGTHPYRLQLAASLIYETRQQGRHGFTRARNDFNSKAREMFWSRVKKSQNWQGLWLLLCWLFLKLPRKVGSTGLWLADFWNDSKDTVLGMVIIVVIALTIIGLFNPQQFYEFLKNLLNLAK